MKLGSDQTGTGNIQAVILTVTKEFAQKIPNLRFLLSDQSILEDT